VQDNTLRSTDGFFAIVNPRLDAIEEVSVSTAAQGADVGQGAVQVRFVTRSGTNTFTGSGYWYTRRDRFNENTWFNIKNNVAKPKLKQDQIGARVGGPIMIPGLFDGRNKAFFFVNWEEFRSRATSRDRPAEYRGQQGIYSYRRRRRPAGQLLELAAQNGRASVDPITAACWRNRAVTGLAHGTRPEPAALRQRRSNDAPVSDVPRRLQPRQPPVLDGDQLPEVQRLSTRSTAARRTIPVFRSAPARRRSGPASATRCDRRSGRIS
jgi:hypothetical protein